MGTVVESTNKPVAPSPLGDHPLSSICFGGEPLGGTDWGTHEPELLARAVEHAVDCGINFFDTAAVYGLGNAEQALADYLGARRHDLLIATKMGMAWSRETPGGRAKIRIDNSFNSLQKSLEQSLTNLQLDILPLVYVHNPDPNTPVEELAESLVRLQHKELLKAIGLSNHSLAAIQSLHSLIGIDAVQILFNIAEDSPEKRAILEFCNREGIFVTCYGALNRGLFTGKYDLQSSFGENDRRARLPDFQGEELAYRLRIVDALRGIAEQRKCSVASVAVRWILDTQGISSAILGMKSPEQVNANLDCLGWSLTSEELEHIKCVTAARNAVEVL